MLTEKTCFGAESPRSAKWFAICFYGRDRRVGTSFSLKVMISDPRVLAYPSIDIIYQIGDDLDIQLVFI